MECNTAVKENSSGLPPFTVIIRNILLSYGITMVLLLIFAFIITYTDFPEGLVSGTVLVMSIIGVALAGFLTARSGKTKGWLCGAASGVIYMITLYCLSSLVFRNVSFGLNTVAMLAIGLFAGTFGGIFGINTKKGARR